MSAHAAARRADHVRADFSAGLRLSSVIVVPSALVLAVLGPDLAEVFLAHGATSVASARYMGEVFAVLCLGLVPYTVFQLQLRVFYALHDSRTPALIGVVTMIVNVGANYAALAMLPPGQVVAGLGFAFGLGNLAGSALAWRLLSRRLGGMDGRVIGGCLLRTHAAAVPPALLALAMSLAAATVLPRRTARRPGHGDRGRRRGGAALSAAGPGLPGHRAHRPARDGNRAAAPVISGPACPGPPRAALWPGPPSRAREPTCAVTGALPRASAPPPARARRPARG